MGSNNTPKSVKSVKNSETPKKVYEKPQITFTEIQVTQALMGICKATGTAGPFGPNCPGPCSGGS